MQHTHIQRMRHRHMVVLPVFIALLTAGFAGQALHLSSNVSLTGTQISTESLKRFSLLSGVYGVLYSGGSFTESQGAISLEEGSVLLASDGIIRLRAGETAFTAFDGAFHVTRASGDTTVAAITTPVAVTIGEQRMVVPAGMQWTLTGDLLLPFRSGFDNWMTSRTPTQLPAPFILRKLEDLSLVSIPNPPLPSPRFSLPRERTITGNFLLPSSEERMRSKRHEKALGALRFLVERGDADSLPTLLEQPLLSEALRTPRGRTVLAFLLSSVPATETGVRMALLSHLAEDDALWLVVSLHPIYRDIAWALDDPEFSVEALITRVLIFPFAAFTKDPLADFVFQRHRIALSLLREKVGDRVSFTEHAVAAHVPLVSSLRDLGYPMRAKNLRATLQNAIESLDVPGVVLSDALRTLQESDTADLSPLPPRVPSEENTVVVLPQDLPMPAVVLSPSEVEQRAYVSLSAAGALFQVHTIVEATGQNTARVEDILFSGPKADRLASFTLDVVTGTVSNIVVDGKSDFPYTPSFAGFTEWLRK